MRQILRLSAKRLLNIAILCSMTVLCTIMYKQTTTTRELPQVPRQHIVRNENTQLDYKTANVNIAVEVPVDKTPVEKKKKRPGLIIMGFSRSGTSYMDTIFNHDPEIFTVHEPLQIPNRWREKGADFEFDYDSAISDIIGAHMNCDFTKNNITRQHLIEFGDYWRFRKQSHALSSPPFCKTPDIKESCETLNDDKKVSQTCLQNYKASVIKICYERIPPRPVCKLGFVVRLVEQLEAMYPDIDVKILNLVRDPRGLVNSRVNMGWIAEYPSEGLEKESHRLCKILDTIIHYGRNITGVMKTKYRELQYDDFFSDPIAMTEDLYKFAGFHQVPEVVKEYVRISTNPPQEVWQETEKKWGSVIRNSSRNLERWKREGSVERNRVVEKSCENIFRLLNLKHWAWDPASKSD